MAKILLINLSTSDTPPPSAYKELLLNKLRAEQLIQKRWNPTLLTRGTLTYSRGLLSIAAYLEEAGYQVTYKDWEGDTSSQISPILENEFDIVGISCVTPTFPMAIEIFKKIKDLNPQILTVLGGSHVTYFAENIITEHAPLIDIIVQGEGEVTMYEIVKNPLQLSNIKGITFLIQHRSGRPFSSQRNPEREPCNIDNLPKPAYHLLPFPLGNYAHNIMFSRGCSFKCTYCVDGWYFTQFRYSSIEKVLSELCYLANKIPKGAFIHFCDSIFDFNKKYIRELLQAIIRADLGLRFSCDLRVRTITKENIELMKAAGFIKFCLGIESGNDSLLKAHKQNQKLKESLCACKLIREVYPEAFIFAYWVTGLPGTTLQSLEHDAVIIQKFVQDRIVNMIGNKLFVPYPGTPIFNSPEKFGMIIRHKDWSKYFRICKPVYDLHTMNAETIFQWFLTLERILLDSYCRVLEVQLTDLKNTLLTDYYLGFGLRLSQPDQETHTQPQ